MFQLQVSLFLVATVAVAVLLFPNQALQLASTPFVASDFLSKETDTLTKTTPERTVSSKNVRMPHRPQVKGLKEATKGKLNILKTNIQFFCCSAI